MRGIGFVFGSDPHNPLSLSCHGRYEILSTIHLAVQRILSEHRKVL